jgi:hypothetical protein
MYPGFIRYRLDPPMYDSDGKPQKYTQAAKKSGDELGTHLYILPTVEKILADPYIPLAITEGENKAACLTQNGIPCIGIAGVSCWGDGEGGLHREFDPVNFADRTIPIIFDSDAWTKRKDEIGKQLYSLGKAIEKRGGKAEAVLIPPDRQGLKQGADDYIVKNGIDKFHKLKHITLKNPALSQYRSGGRRRGNVRKTRRRKSLTLGPSCNR